MELAPAAGTFGFTASVSANKWPTNGQQMGRRRQRLALSIRKKDAQRCAEIKSIQLRADGMPSEMKFQIDLQAGHELLILPLCPDYNNGVEVHVEKLKVKAGR